MTETYTLVVEGVNDASEAAPKSAAVLPQVTVFSTQLSVTRWTLIAFVVSWVTQSLRETEVMTSPAGIDGRAKP